MQGESRLFDRGLVLAAGLAGALGVALSAVAAHAAGASELSTAANFLLMHAPALLVLGLAAPGRLGRLAGWGMVAGLVLFCGDLVARHVIGTRLFPYAAPTGGMVLIASWLAVGASALRWRSR